MEVMFRLTRPNKLGTRVDSMPARIALFGKISVSVRVKGGCEYISIGEINFNVLEEQICIMKKNITSSYGLVVDVS